MHTSIRRYEGLFPDRTEELIKRVEDGFVAIMSSGEGFLVFTLSALEMEQVLQSAHLRRSNLHALKCSGSILDVIMVAKMAEKNPNSA